MIRLDTTSEQSILNMLREHNALNGQQIKQIESLSKESGKSQIETAFELNITNDTKVAELLSESFSIPLIKLDDIKVDNNLKKFTEIRFLKENLIIPFAVESKTIKVAIADASKFGLIKNIESYISEGQAKEEEDRVRALCDDENQFKSYKKGKICLGMHIEVVKEIKGYKYDEKRNISADKETYKYKYGKFTTSRGNKRYKLEVTYENDRVVSFKDL